MPQANRVAIYARHATATNEQVERAREFLGSQDYDNPNDAIVFADEGDATVALDALVSAVAAETIDLVVVESYDRITRDQGDLIRLRAVLARHKARLLSID